MDDLSGGQGTLGSDKRLGSSWSWLGVLALVVLVVSAAALFLTWRWQAVLRLERGIVIATGPEQGTYAKLGERLAGALEREGVAARVEAVSSAGSVENMIWLDEPVGPEEVRFAFAQSDAVAPQDARLVAQLYPEVLHVLVASNAAGEIGEISDLDGRRVDLGEIGSGTRQVAQKLIDHFEIEPAEASELPPGEAAEGLRSGNIDAAFVLAAIPSEVVDRLSDDLSIRFLSLGAADAVGTEADALATVFPAVQATIIPRHAYGRLPETAIRSVGVWAQLVTTKAAPPHLVRDVALVLFEHRAELAGLRRDHAEDDRGGALQLSAASKIRESYDPATSALPYHDGAAAYYRRDEPSFVVKYAETGSFALALLVLSMSGLLAVREWVKRRKKNRIDSYYLEIERLSSRSADTVDTLEERLRALDAIRRRAFADLIAERLEANESFTIFQDFLQSETASVTTQLSTHVGGGRPSERRPGDE